jgi:hypothetical protein
MDEIKLIVEKYNPKLSEFEIQLICENIMTLLFDHNLEESDDDEDEDSVEETIEIGETNDGFFYLK